MRLFEEIRYVCGWCFFTCTTCIAVLGWPICHWALYYCAGCTVACVPCVVKCELLPLLLYAAVSKYHFVVQYVLCGMIGIWLSLGGVAAL